MDVITRSLAQELGPQNIRVNSLAPGLVETEGTKAAGTSDGEFKKLAVSRTPLGRMGVPQDIAKVAVSWHLTMPRGSPEKCCRWVAEHDSNISEPGRAGFLPALPLRGTIHFLTNAFSAFTLARSSRGSSMGVSAMNTACAVRASFSSFRKGISPIDPFPMC